MKSSKRTVVLGASPKVDRISNQAVADLKANGHEVIPVHPVAAEIQGEAVRSSLAEVSEDIDTLTVYMNAKRSSGLEAEILSLKPKRVIFNPGAENAELAESLVNAGMRVENACTLILLRTGQY